ncbi:hypothetical protein [Catellatospora sp. NPDC049609]|uniref:hypothetical protein n=1 Tax=Catellatospora sp. NPDC049609 TaxID=3155505 RepID=UPI00343A8CEE
MASRWRGQRGRCEVWYTTITDPATGTGIWLHHELISPSTPGTSAYGHGFVAVFPPDAAPTMVRFGPCPWRPQGDTIFATDTVAMTRDSFTGAVGPITWDLTATCGSTRPMFTFPHWAWCHGLLPAAHLVATPGARHTGTVHIGEHVIELRDAPGATSRIYGHGNARRWCWLHADLGNGNILEIVAAVAMRPGLRRLPPLPMVKLRLDGADWPAHDPLLASFRFRADIGLPRWTVTGASGGRRLQVTVHQPPERTLAVAYTDPDGRTCTCHNTEVADADILLERRGPDGWQPERRWRLQGTAHAEVGLR